MKRSAEYWIERLEMFPHPEGGYFRETYRSEEIIRNEHLPERFSSERNFSTAIFYLLKDNQTSKLHRLKADEIFHYYDGSGMIIYIIDENGNLIKNKLGTDFDKGERPQVLIKAGCWFGAKVSEPNSYCLAGCTVAPGFHFDDFEMGDRKKLLELFPQHKSVIELLTN